MARADVVGLARRNEGVVQIAVKCPYRAGNDTVEPHNGTDVAYGFDSIQCLECGGHFKLDGTPTVPTSALEVGGTYNGPGADLIEAPAEPAGDQPARARDWRK
jgi:hypothetical protein